MIMVIVVSLEKVVMATKTAANLVRGRYRAEVQMTTTSVKSPSKQDQQGHDGQRLKASQKTSRKGLACQRTLAASTSRDDDDGSKVDTGGPG